MAGTASLPSSRYGTKASLRREATPRWRPWLSLILLAMLVKLLYLVITLVDGGASPDPVTALISSWDRWDAPHYLYLAEHGYATSGDLRNLIAFLPLYPAMIGILAHAGVAAPVAALLISNLGGLAAAILLYEIGRQDGDEKAAWRAAALFTFFPTAYFLLNGYTEGLFCALAFGAVLAGRRGRFITAGILSGLAASTRLTGLALWPWMATELYLARHAIRRIWSILLALVLIPLGFLSYLVTNWLVLKDPLAFVEVQQQHWYHRLAPPWSGLQEAVQGIFWRDPWSKLTVGAGEVAGATASYAVSVLSWLKLRPADAAYAVALTVMTTFLPFWLSIPRYLLSMYPLFLLAGRVRSPFIQGLAAALSFVGFVVFGLAFARGLWAF
jgi:cell division protein FtsB